MLSQSIEDYLKAVYKIAEHGWASTSDIARVLDVAAPSVTGMVKKLAENGLLLHTPHKGVKLTEAGMKVALEIIRHHRLLELYLTEALGYTIDKVHEEAERLEHHISEEFEDKISELLGNPTHDPHGDPIPTREGFVPEKWSTPLTRAEAGKYYIVQRVSDSDSDMLRYLVQMGLVPKTKIEVVDVSPFNGPITVRIGSATQVVWSEIATNVFVSELID